MTWQVATVDAVSAETASVRTIMLSVPDWAGHAAGQHLDVRLRQQNCVDLLGLAALEP